MRLVVVVLAVFAVFSLVGSASADDKKAAAHYKQGAAYEKAGAYDKAVDEYKAAHALDRKTSHLFNIARVYDLAGDPRSAIGYYEKFIAAEPGGPKAKEAREALAVATKKLADQEAATKKLADEKAAQAKKLADEKERIRVAAEGHLKQAAELARKGAWASAAEEYVRATEIDGDPEHLIDAGEAYRKHPELAKAKLTFQLYLDKVPNGPRSDEIRSKVADLARDIEIDRVAKAKADADAKAKPTVTKPRVESPPRAPRARARSRGKKLLIAGLAFGGLSGVNVYLGYRAIVGIERGTEATGRDIEGAINQVRIHKYAALAFGAVALVGISIGGITIGANLGADEPLPVITMRRSL